MGDNGLHIAPIWTVHAMAERLVDYLYNQLRAYRQTVLTMNTELHMHQALSTEV